MFDCGMHMGYNDHRRFPNFDFISRTGDFTQKIDVVIISHFHLDHCGSLPHFTEQRGYSGPIIMTLPTKAICPILLEDYRKITAERKGEKNFFTSTMIKNCMSKVTTINLHETLTLYENMEVSAYYAGHVIGAAMFRVKVGNESVVYTGDYNMTPDRHLGSAWIDRCCPDVLITETTYATTVRNSKKNREQQFLNRIKECVTNGGKVLIPVFALGRAQELCILIDTFWDRLNLQAVPIYFSAGLTSKANLYYKLFLNWTNQKLKDSFLQDNDNKFEFNNIKPFDRSLITHPGPMVVFATPGMLHAGMSLEIFKAWAGNPKNLVILPGYCVAGTVGNKLLSGQTKIVVDKHTTIDVKLQVANLSFSAHADANGILQLLRQSNARNVVLVHGEKKKMLVLKEKVEQELGMACFAPANGSTISIPRKREVPVQLSASLFRDAQHRLLPTRLPATQPLDGLFLPLIQALARASPASDNEVEEGGCHGHGYGAREDSDEETATACAEARTGESRSYTQEDSEFTDASAGAGLGGCAPGEDWGASEAGAAAPLTKVPLNAFLLIADPSPPSAGYSATFNGSSTSLANRNDGGAGCVRLLSAGELARETGLTSHALTFSTWRTLTLRPRSSDSGPLPLSQRRRLVWAAVRALTRALSESRFTHSLNSPAIFSSHSNGSGTWPGVSVRVRQQPSMSSPGALGAPAARVNACDPDGEPFDPQSLQLSLGTLERGGYALDAIRDE